MSDSNARLPLLVLDTASRRVCAALIEKSDSVTTRFSDEEASLSLFPIINDLLEERAMKLSDLRAIAFCEGPGSMLGIRTAIMGIRTWMATKQLEDCKLFSFNSLQVGSQIIANTPNAPASYLVVTDARRQSWNCLKVDSSKPTAIELIENPALEKSDCPIYSFDEFPSWTRTEADIVRFPYRPESIFQSAAFPRLLKANPNAEPLSARTLEFAKWVPQARTADQIES